MRDRRLNTYSIISTLFGVSATLAVIVGSGVCVAGLAAVGTIELAKFFKPNRPTYQKMILYGGGAVMAGLFCNGCLAYAVNRHQNEEESTSQGGQQEQTIINGAFIPYACIHCKHYHGVSYNGIPFICAIHPSGPIDDNCPDWEKESKII